MSDQIVRVAMWSGPRNISTALMRAFENRPDAVVVDEPLYAAYLAATGLDHPMRAEILAAQPTDWRRVVADLDAPPPAGRTLIYEKHMTHHVLADYGLDWTDVRRNAFLIRDPAKVLASYVKARGEASLDDIGVVRQAELFQRESDRLGAPAPVIESEDVLADPRGHLVALCRALDLPFREQMLSWPAGPRASDGVWAPVWYRTVEASTGFAAKDPDRRPPDLPDALKRAAEAARPYYETLHAHRLRAETALA